MNREEITAVRNELAQASNALRDESTKDYEDTSLASDGRLFVMGQLSYHLGALIRRLDIELNNDLTTAGVVANSVDHLCGPDGCEPKLVNKNDPPEGSLILALQQVADQLAQRYYGDQEPSTEVIIRNMAADMGFSRATLVSIIDNIKEEVQIAAI